MANELFSHHHTIADEIIFDKYHIFGTRNESSVELMDEAIENNLIDGDGVRAMMRAAALAGMAYARYDLADRMISGEFSHNYVDVPDALREEAAKLFS